MRLLLQVHRRHHSATLRRHGQYDLDSPAHALTQLGRQQAEITAQRIAALAADNAAIDDHYGRRPVRLVRLVHSDVTRAAETAAIIAKALPSRVAVEVDALLAEGYPCVPEPCRVQVRRKRLALATRCRFASRVSLSA